MKYLKLWNLQELIDNNRDLYSPDGETLTVVNNGFLGGQLLYDRKNKKIYGLRFVDLTKKANKEFFEDCEFWARVKDIKYKLSKNNIDEVELIVNSKK